MGVTVLEKWTLKKCTKTAGGKKLTIKASKSHQVQFGVRYTELYMTKHQQIKAQSNKKRILQF